jgi:hypothetical protein
MAGFMEAYYDAQKGAQQVQENAIDLQTKQLNLDALKQSMADKATEDLLLSESAQDAFSDQPSVLSTATTPSDTKVAPPVGMPGTTAPKEGLMGLGGMQQGITGVEQPETASEQPKQTVVQQAQSSANKVDQSQKLINIYQKSIEAAAKAGKSSIVADLSKKLSDEQDNYAKNQKEHLENVLKTYDVVGRVGTGYINSGQTEADWARAKLEFSKDGFPIDTLNNANTPEQRLSIAKQAQGMSEKSNDVIREQIAQLNAKRVADKEAALQAWREKNYLYKEKNDAANREIKKEEFAMTRGDKLGKEHFDQLKGIVESQQKNVTEIDGQIKQLETQKSNIASLKDVINTKTGKAYTPEEIKQQSDVLDAEISELRNTKSEALDQIATGQAYMKEAGLKPTATPKADTTPAKETTAKPTEATPKYDSLDANQKGWVDRALAANPGMSKEDVIAQGVQLGKIGSKAPAATTTTTESEAVKFINSQADLDRAIKLKLLKPEEIKQAKEKLKKIAERNKEIKASKADEDRISKLQDLSIKSGPLSVFTL